jgi:hypothetical protein
VIKIPHSERAAFICLVGSGIHVAMAIFRPTGDNLLWAAGLAGVALVLYPWKRTKMDDT